MIVSSAFAGKRYAILGLARSGLAAAEALLASGASVVAWDRQDVARDKLAGRAELADPLELDLTGYDGVVVSPGVPLNTHPIADYAKKFGVPVIGDIELFSLARSRLPAHSVIGITGTNGKSTSTALIHHILATAGIPTLMGGNIGIPIMEQDPLPAGGVYVLELSSYQIDLTQSLDCDVAMLLNVTPDHLDRYDSFEAYGASKARLFHMQSEGHAALLPISARHLPAIGALDSLSQRVSWLGAPYNGGHNAGDQNDWPSLQGPHNLENVQFARHACEQIGLTQTQIEAGLRSFVGLPHRMEFVAEDGGVIFINDSKATNADSAAPALAAYPPVAAINGGLPRIHWIVGGLAKEDGLGACENFLGNIKAAYTIGESGPNFAAMLEGRILVERCELLSEAVTQAAANAMPGDVILLSPACASFDQFRDYEKRGEYFRQIVTAITEVGEGS